MSISKWSTSHIKFYLCWLILMTELIMDLGVQACPVDRDWGDCSRECENEDECEGSLICCPSKCGRHCVTLDFVPNPPTSPTTKSDTAPLAGGTPTTVTWYYYAGAAGGALLLLVVISVIVVVIVRRRKAAANQNKENILTTPPPPPPPRTPKRNNEDVYCYIDEGSAPRERAPVPAVSTHHNATFTPAVFSPTVMTSPHNMMTSPHNMMTSQPEVMMVSPVIVDEQFMAVAFANNPTMIGHEEWSQLDFPEEGWVGLYPPVPNSNFYVSS